MKKLFDIVRPLYGLLPDGVWFHLSLFYGFLCAAAVGGSWGAFFMAILLILYRRFSIKNKYGVRDYLMSGYTLYGLSLYVCGLLVILLYKLFGEINYVITLVAISPMVVSTIYLNRVFDAIEASVQHIEFLKTLRYALVLPLFFLLLGIRTWSVDASLFGFIPYVLIAHIIISRKRKELKLYQTNNPNMVVNPNARMQRPSSTTMSIVWGSVACVAVHLLVAIPDNIGFDPTTLFDSALAKVAIPLCVLGFVIFKYYSAWERRVVGVDKSDASYKTQGEIMVFFSMLSGIVAALIGFESPQASATMLCFCPILALYAAYLFTYNNKRRLAAMIFAFCINLVAGIIGIAAAWLAIFLLLIVIGLRFATQMIGQTLANPFGTGVNVPDGSRLMVWDPDLGRSVELHNTGSGLFDLQGNPWEEGLSGGFKPKGSDRTPLSGSEF